MKKLSSKKKGFTLLELLIVIVVLAVLAGLALPRYLQTVGRSKEAEGWQTLAAIRSAIMRYYSEDEQLPTPGLAACPDPGFDQLDLDNPNCDAIYPNRIFDYSWAVGGVGPDGFIITADPVGGAGTGSGPDTGVRTLTLDNVGTRNRL